MIAVTFALPSESRAFRRHLASQRGEVAILHTGVGAAACRQRLEPFLDAQPFDIVISSGFAGGIDPSLGVADLLLAENFSDPGLLARAQALLTVVRDSVEPGKTSFPTHVARLVTTDRIVETAAERADLARGQGAAAVDMETRWIAEACARREIPLLSLRVISDTAAAPLPAPPEVLFDLEQQRVPAATLLGFLWRHPLALVRLVRFASRINGARRHLTEALLTLAPVLHGKQDSPAAL